MFGRVYLEGSKKSYQENIAALKEKLASCDAVVIGAGSGLSTAAGYRYSGDIFGKYFWDFAEKYGIRDMYSGGFYPFPTMEEYYAWWSRHIWVNRYAPIPTNLYEELLKLVKDKDYFVLTTNVDHCFQRAGFDKRRLFYTQGDYGLFQSVRPHAASAGKTYDNEEMVRKMLLSQGFVIGDNNALLLSEELDANASAGSADGLGGSQSVAGKKGSKLNGDALAAARKKIRMSIDSSLIPLCPDDGQKLVPNLRSDDTFVEDEGWHQASERYSEFLRRHSDLDILFLELGVGGNTPVIIKYPFWQYMDQNDNATYACINMGEALAPRQIIDRSILIDGDIRAAVADVLY